MHHRPAWICLLLLLAAFGVRADAKMQASDEVRIGQVQGPGEVSPYADQSVAVHGVVTADFQTREARPGFFLQDTGDGDDATSDGIFVAAGPDVLDVAVGDELRVSGTVAELAGETTLTRTTLTRIATTTPPAPRRIALPLAQAGELERSEGMLVVLEQLTVVQALRPEHGGQLLLAGPDAQGQPGRLLEPTQLHAPGSEEARAFADQQARRTIMLIDAQAQLTKPDPVRAGDLVPSLIGVFEQHGDLRALQPTAAVELRAENPRPSVPSAEGLRVASVNLHNFFTSLGRRGAANEAELTRQRSKLVESLLQLDAAIYGLTELENNTGSHSATASLVSALNRATRPGTFAAIDTGKLGSDEIKVALLYRVDRVAPVGRWAALDDRLDPRAISTRNRPPLAQTFRELASSEELTVVVNHWRSRASACDAVHPGSHELVDPDTGDGQGHCNKTRVSMAEALHTWLGKRPTGTRDTDVLVIGDLNSYAREDPVRTLESHGFVNLVERQLGASAYTYVFDGRAGYLDHALASPSLAAKLNRVAIWHSNADEPQSTGEEPSGPYRASDHDALLVAFTLRDGPPAPPVPTIDDTNGWILLFGATLLLLIASGTAARRKRASAGQEVLGRVRSPSVADVART
ncbi:MAG: ExeM/NucH family extracellular endonuclease [Polyangiales bacterium]